MSNMEISDQAAEPYVPVEDPRRTGYEIKRHELDLDRRGPHGSNWGRLLVAVIPTALAAGLLMVQSMGNSSQAAENQSAEHPAEVSDPLVWEQQKWRAEYDSSATNLSSRSRSSTDQPGAVH